jgi:hypothetical protein
MRAVGAGVAIGLLAAAVMGGPSPAAAFGLRIGPFHIGLPLFRHPFAHRHRQALPAEERTSMASRDGPPNPSEAPAGPGSPLLYPVLALPAIYDEIFSGAASAPWPFGYDAILRTAFAKPPTSRQPGRLDQGQCQQAVRGTAVIDRIESEINPEAAQRAALQKLGESLAMASGFLARQCPKDIPAEPVPRLQIMGTQVQELTLALDIIREPLQQLQQSLSARQGERWAAMSQAAAAGGKARSNDVATCAAAPTAIDWSVDELTQSLQPNDAQRDALAEVRQAFARAARDLDALCPTSPLPNPLARLASTEARLDAEWRAILTIGVALAGLEQKLTDDQRARFNSIDFASVH